MTCAEPEIGEIDVTTPSAFESATGRLTPCLATSTRVLVIVMMADCAFVAHAEILHISYYYDYHVVIIIIALLTVQN